jgi:hypothetical protein
VLERVREATLESQLVKGRYVPDPQDTYEHRQSREGVREEAEPPLERRQTASHGTQQRPREPE